MQIQFLYDFVHLLRVVICFKFSNFAYANTVNYLQHIPQHKLLFALNLVTLLMQIQYNIEEATTKYCCYLL